MISTVRRRKIREVDAYNDDFLRQPMKEELEHFEVTMKR